MASEHWKSIPVLKLSHPVTTWAMSRRHKSTSIKFASKEDWETLPEQLVWNQDSVAYVKY